MVKRFRHLKVAIVTDWMLAPGGADRLLFSLLKIFPRAEIFTSIYNPKKYTGNWKVKNKVHQTFLAKFPFKYQISRHLNVLAPVAFESLDMAGFDLVITLSAGPAKGVITELNQPLISVIFTPPRYLWDGDQNFRSSRLAAFYKWISPLVSTYLRIWDLSAIKRSHHIVSISEFIKGKVRRTYQKESNVIYPGIPAKWFEQQKFEKVPDLPKDYFLFVSRLYDYKRVDWALKAAIDACENIVIVGSGPDAKTVKKLKRKNKNITYFEKVTDNQLGYLYKNAKALLFPALEDFGLVMVEAMSVGCPVLALNKGGAAEIVEHGITGELFADYEELVKYVRTFDRSKYENDKIISRARMFTENNFIENFIKYIDDTFPKLTE